MSTGVALKHTYEKAFSTENGMRRNVPKVVVAITDGRSQDEVKKNAAKLQHAGKKHRLRLGVTFYHSNRRRLRVLGHGEKTCRKTQPVHFLSLCIGIESELNNLDNLSVRRMGVQQQLWVPPTTLALLYALFLHLQVTASSRSAWLTWISWSCSRLAANPARGTSLSWTTLTLSTPSRKI